MASGGKRMQINTRERLVSTDHNRLQAFASAERAEFARFMMAYVATEGGWGALVSTTTSPLFGMILNGLWARPEIGTVNLFIEPGVIGVVNPDAVPSSDDSPFKVFKDDGVTLAGQLVLTPGGGGGTRIDVIECSRIEEVVESDNRDIFNPGTGLFTPALVDKVKRDRLTFRIRSGAPGGGFASVGTASGWMPLAIASVPTTATSWDDVTLWDVRPLFSDLVRSTPVTQVFPTIGKMYGSAYDNAVNKRIFGVFESTRSQWRVGGEVGSSLSGLVSGGLQLDGADTIEPGFPSLGSLPWTLFAMQPFGLPRWARYSPATSGLRVPLAFRGIPVYSQKTTNFAGVPVAAVSLPTASGLGGSSQEGAAVATGGLDNLGAFLNANYADGWTLLSGTMATVTPASGANTANPIYELQDGTHFPRGATMVRLRILTTLNASLANAGFTLQRNVQCLDAAAVVISESVQGADKDSKNTSSTSDFVEVDVPLHATTNMPSGSTVTRRFRVAYSTSGLVVITYAGQQIQVVGWRMGMS